tara:strand:- start:68 stop:949 length:882 start_codon:yes stop_codon:yes gene_type:complete
MKKAVLFNILATIFLSCGNQATMDNIDIQRTILKQFDEGDPIPMLKKYIKEPKEEITKIMLWFQVLIDYPQDGNEKKLEQIRRAVYEVLYTRHLDEIDGGEKILNYERDLPISNVSYTGEQQNIEITQIITTIEKPSMSIFGFSFNVKAAANKLSSKTGIEDKSYYGPSVHMEVEFKINSKHYYEEKENDVLVDFIFTDPQTPKRFDDIVLKPKLQGSNINSDFRWDPSDKIHEATLELPIWSAKKWNDRESRWMDDIFDMFTMMTYLSMAELKEVKIRPYHNSKFNNKGYRL